jgi:hypothetical protein
MSAKDDQLDIPSDDPVDYCRTDLDSLNNEESLASSVNVLLRSLISRYPAEYTTAVMRILNLKMNSGQERDYAEAIRLLAAAIIYEHDQEVQLVHLLISFSLGL